MPFLKKYANVIIPYNSDDRKENQVKAHNGSLIF